VKIRPHEGLAWRMSRRARRRRRPAATRDHLVRARVGRV